jgi:hypothetical protein
MLLQAGFYPERSSVEGMERKKVSKCFATSFYDRSRVTYHVWGRMSKRLLASEGN